MWGPSHPTHTLPKSQVNATRTVIFGIHTTFNKRDLGDSMLQNTYCNGAHAVGHVETVAPHRYTTQIPSYYDKNRSLRTEYQFQLAELVRFSAEI